MYYHRMFYYWSTVGPGKLEKPEMCAGGPMCASCVYSEGTGVQPLTGFCQRAPIMRPTRTPLHLFPASPTHASHRLRLKDSGGEREGAGGAGAGHKNGDRLGRHG